MNRLGPAQTAFLDAVGNDRRGVFSERDAKKLLDAAVGEIAASSTPVAAFEGNQRFFTAARALLGRDADAARLLDAYEAKGQDAVAARLAELGSPNLPPRLERRIRDVFEGHEMIDEGARLPISNVRGDPEGGYRFRYEHAGETHTAYFVPHQGDFVLAPARVSERTLEAATATMQAYFDEHFAAELADYGASAAEIADMRAAIRPERAKLAGEYSDPYGYVDEHALVFVMANPTETDHGFFVGSDLRGRNQEAYSFN